MIFIFILSLFSYGDIQIQVPDNMPVPLELKSLANFNENQQKQLAAEDHTQRISRCLQQMFNDLDRSLNHTPNSLKEVNPLKPSKELLTVLKALREKGLNPRAQIILEQRVLRVAIQYTENGEDKLVSLHNFVMDLGGNLSYSICSASNEFHRVLRAENYSKLLIHKLHKSRVSNGSVKSETLVLENEQQPANH